VCARCVAVMLHTWDGKWPFGVEEGGVGSMSMLLSDNTDVDVESTGGGGGFFLLFALLLLLLLFLSFL